MGGSLKSYGLAPYNSQLKGKNSLVFYSKVSLGAVTRIFVTLVIVGVASGALPQMYPLQPSTSNSNESTQATIARALSAAPSDVGKAATVVGKGSSGQDEGCDQVTGWRGDIVNCQKRVVSGVTTDGGYAEVMIAEARGISSVPDDLKSAKAAPLLCAGITTYNALRNAGLRGEDLVAVQGVGDG